jgi:methyl-galactoside transport system permease protein
VKKVNIQKKELQKFIINNALYVVLFLLLLIIVIKEPSFLNIRNFKNVLTQSSVRIIIALGVAGLIVTQGTDLSAGRQVGFSAVVAATLLQATDNVNKVFPNLGDIPIPVVIIAVMILGAVLGLINGIIISKFNVTPFIATLGTMIMIYGANSLYYDFVGATPVSGFVSRYSTFAQGSLNFLGLDIPFLIIYALISIIFMWVLWNKTIFGKNLFAVGGNPEAATVSGVNVTKTLIKVYALSGVFYALGGMLEAGRIGSATNNLGNMYELDAIAACVVGGVSFSGGVGTVPGVVIGVIIFTVINYGLTYIGVNPYWQFIIKGFIIIAAVALDTMKHSKKK